jgi:hypothetical protein
LSQILDRILDIATHVTIHGYVVIAPGTVFVHKAFQTSIVFLGQGLVPDDNGEKRASDFFRRIVRQIESHVRPP